MINVFSLGANHYIISSSYLSSPRIFYDEYLFLIFIEKLLYVREKTKASGKLGSKQANY